MARMQAKPGERCPHCCRTHKTETTARACRRRTDRRRVKQQ